MGASVQFNVGYNIPRVNVALPGKQNRAGTGRLRVSAGVTEPIEFHFCNSDGVPINLNAFKARLVFWYSPTDYDKLPADRNPSGVVLAKDLEFQDAYAGRTIVLLSNEDTAILARSGRQTLRWSIYLINDVDQVFPMQITSDGERFGLVHIENAGMPSAEVVAHLAVSK